MPIVDHDRLEQAAAEVVQPVLDFVAHAGLARPDLVGAPQDFDLQLQRVDQVVALEGAQARIGQCIDDPEHFALVEHDRASARFRRVRGKHRLVQQAIEQCLQRLRLDTLLVKLLQRVEERTDPGGVAVFLHRHAPQAVQVVFLGEVDQVEVNRESADNLGHDPRFETRDQVAQQLAVRCRAGAAG